jgi:hypothetical protein
VTRPAGRARVEYRKPRKINVVSVSMLLVLGAIGYVLFALWPVYTLRASVKGELQEVLPRLWKLNLLPDVTSRPELVKMRKELLDRLRKVGVTDKKLELIVERDKKRVALEARFSTEAHFPWLDKRKVFHLAPRAETDAARVEW